jgi:hypothetical protein
MRLRALLAAALVLPFWLAPAAPASAADAGTTSTGVVIDQGDGQVRQAIRIERIYPKASRQAVLFLDDAAHRVRRMQVGVDRLQDFENDCVHAEIGTGDTSCGKGAGQGELSRYLDVDLRAGRAAGTGGDRTCTPAMPPKSAALADLAEHPVIVGLPDDAGTMCVIATFTHIDSATDNLTQSDSVDFDLGLHLDSTTVAPAVAPAGASDDMQPEVLGASFERPVAVRHVAHGRMDLNGLAYTGSPVMRILEIGVLLVAAGAMVLTAARRRQRGRQEVAP